MRRGRLTWLARELVEHCTDQVAAERLVEELVGARGGSRAVLARIEPALAGELTEMAELGDGHAELPSLLDPSGPSLVDVGVVEIASSSQIAAGELHDDDGQL